MDNVFWNENTDSTQELLYKLSSSEVSNWLFYFNASNYVAIEIPTESLALCGPGMETHTDLEF